MYLPPVPRLFAGLAGAAALTAAPAPPPGPLEARMLRLTELLEVAHQEWGAIKFEESTVGAHHIKEAPNVANPFVGLRRRFASELGE
jgi:hypothetical protein